MFLGQLEDRQKEAFLVLADRVIRADGVVAEQEEAMLAAMKTEMGLPSDMRPDDRSVEDVAPLFSSRPSKVAALLELIGLSMADGHYHDDEAAVLESIKNSFNVTPAEYEVMRNWVIRQLALVREVNVLMTAEA